MLTFDNLEIAQGDFRLTANFAVQPGGIIAVMGPSGAGKSTLLNAVAGFTPVTGGRIAWGQTDLGPLSPQSRPIAMLFQDQNLFPHLTAFENAALALTPRRRLTTDQQAQVNAALARVDLAGFEGRKPGALSGGQQSRVALARVMLQGKPLVLLDEPFAALGPALKAEMLDLVAEITHSSGATVMMVSHDPADARRIADQVVLVADGVAHEPAPTAKLLDNPPPSLRDYLGDSVMRKT